ncbi:unnamed protein product, partial [Mesorhabditis spiculigera]
MVQEVLEEAAVAQLAEILEEAHLAEVHLAEEALLAAQLQEVQALPTAPGALLTGVEVAVQGAGIQNRRHQLQAAQAGLLVAVQEVQPLVAAAQLQEVQPPVEAAHLLDYFNEYIYWRAEFGKYDIGIEAGTSEDTTTVILTTPSITGTSGGSLGTCLPLLELDLTSLPDSTAIVQQDWSFAVNSNTSSASPCTITQYTWALDGLSSTNHTAETLYLAPGQQLGNHNVCLTAGSSEYVLTNGVLSFRPVDEYFALGKYRLFLWAQSKSVPAQQQNLTIILDVVTLTSTTEKPSTTEALTSEVTTPDSSSTGSSGSGSSGDDSTNTPTTSTTTTSSSSTSSTTTLSSGKLTSSTTPKAGTSTTVVEMTTEPLEDASTTGSGSGGGSGGNTGGSGSGDSDGSGSGGSASTDAPTTEQPTTTISTRSSSSAMSTTSATSSGSSSSSAMPTTTEMTSTTDSPSTTFIQIVTGNGELTETTTVLDSTMIMDSTTTTGSESTTGDSSESSSTVTSSTSTSSTSTSTGSTSTTVPDGDSPSRNDETTSTSTSSSSISTSLPTSSTTSASTSTILDASPTTSDSPSTVATSTTLLSTATVFRGITPETQEALDDVAAGLNELAAAQSNNPGTPLADAIANITTAAQLSAFLNNVLSGKAPYNVNTTDTATLIAQVKAQITNRTQGLTDIASGMLAQLVNVTIQSPEELQSVLSSLADILKNSFTTSISGTSGYLGAYQVLHGTIIAETYTLVSAMSSARMRTSWATSAPGSFNPGQPPEAVNVINDITKLSTSIQFLSDTDVDVALGSFMNTSIFEPLSFFTLYGDTSITCSDGTQLSTTQTVLWNATVPLFSDSESVPQDYTSITTWLPIQSGSVSVQADSNLESNLVAGTLINATMTTVTVLFNDQPWRPNAGAFADKHDGCNFDPGVHGGDGYWLPDISPGYVTVLNGTFIPFQSYDNQSSLREAFISGAAMQGTAMMNMVGGDTKSYSSVSVSYDGTSLLFQTIDDNLLLESATFTYFATYIGISSGQISEGAAVHVHTTLEVGIGQRIFIDDGLIVRNGSDGYAIIQGTFTTQGDIQLGDVSLTTATILDQSAQKQVMAVLQNAEDFIRANGSSLTPEQQSAVAQQSLSMVTDLFNTMDAALANPSAQDLQNCLAYEKLNYNDIFDVLPKDASQIRYVDEYTEEEWALEATKLIQQQLARQMAAQVKSMLSAVEDMLVATALKNGPLPQCITQTGGGNTLKVCLGNASDVLANPIECNTWTTTFPKTPASLNDTLTGESTIRASMICYVVNPYMYSDNSQYLITSGALDLSLKDLENGTVIPVTEATEQTSIVGPSNATASAQVEMFTATFQSYQILDIHAFYTVQWNTSIVVELQMQTLNRPFANDVWIFLSYQSLPGPRDEDHDFRFQVSSYRGNNAYFVESDVLLNMTGLYYIGVGVMAGVNSTSNDTVQYDTPPGFTGNWTFERNLYFDYTIRVLTKGCYYFLDAEDRYDNQGVTPGTPPVIGDAEVGCATTHFTVFANGIYAPDVPADFVYSYIEKGYVLCCHAQIVIFFMIFHMMLLYLCFLREYFSYEWSPAFIHPLDDNHRNDTYPYVVCVETGYAMFAQTDSGVFINIEGSEGTELRRKLYTDGEIVGTKRLFRWGHTDRFIMTTHRSLGDLSTIRLWIDHEGIGHRESWYCSRVIIKDLHANKNYYFNVKNWFGQQSGDGKTERLIPVTPLEKRHRFKEAFWMHNIAQQINWIAQWSGGGTPNRLRAGVDYHTMTMFAILCIGITANVFSTPHTANYTGQGLGPELNIFGYFFNWTDVVAGLALALIMLIPSFVLPELARGVCSSPEEWQMIQVQNCVPDFKKPPRWNPLWTWGLFTVGVFGFMGVSIVALWGAIKLDVEEQYCFARRFFMQMLFWIFVTEPLKGLIVSLYRVYCTPDYGIVTDPERAYLTLHGVIDKPAYVPPENRELSRTVASINRIKEVKDGRMRDEQLFSTAREVIIFLCSLGILLGLTYYCRDRNGFYYQQQVSQLLVLDPQTDATGFMDINKAEDFWVWLNVTLATALRVSWYDNQPAWDMRGFLNDKVSRAMGYGTVRQVRSFSNVNCKFADQRVAKYFNGCEGVTDKKYEVTVGGYTPGWGEILANVTDDMRNNDSLVPYIYRTAEELEGRDIMGYHDSYTSAGYAANLDGTTDEMQEMFGQMMVDGWIDEHTRAIITEFSIYNAQTNYFAVVQLLLEKPPDGAIYPSYWVETVRLLENGGADGTMSGYFESLYICYVVVITIYQIISIIRNGLTPLLEFWNFVDFLTMLIACASLYAYAFRYMAIVQVTEEFKATNGNVYINLGKQRDYELYFTWLLAFVVFFVFNRRISVLAMTLSKAGGQMASFSICFGIVNMAFNSALFLLLFDKLERFRNMLSVTESGISGMLGKFDLSDIISASPLGSAIFIIFMITGTVILINMFIMIVMYEFEQVRNDSRLQTNDYEIVEHVMRRAGLFNRSDLPPVSFPDSRVYSHNIDQLEHVTPLVRPNDFITLGDDDRRENNVINNNWKKGRRGRR